MNNGTSQYPLALTTVPTGIKLIPNGLPDGNDALMPGGMYALVVETPPARFPLLAGALGSAAKSGIACSVMLPSQPKVFLDRVCSSGFPELGHEIETGHLQVFQLQADFSKKMFRFGPEAFTRELDHFQIASDSLLVFDQADDLLSLHDANLAIDQLQKLGAWTRARNIAVLMVFTRGAATASMQASVSSLMDYLSGLARIGILNDGLAIAFDYWQGPLGTIAARSLALEVSESGLYNVREAGALTEEQAISAGPGADANTPPEDPVLRYFTLDEQVMKLGDTLGGEWRLCTSVLGMIHEAIPFLSPIVFLTFSKDTDLRQLAEAVHTLRLSLSRRTRIVVLEVAASLRYSNEMLLLRLGTNLIMHRDVPSVRLPLLLETLKGQVYTKDVDINFEAALGSVVTPRFKGYVPAATFVRETLSMLERADMLGIPNTLLVGCPAQGQTAQALIDAVHLPRMGDLLTADHTYCYLFLSSCPKASQGAAFDSIFKASLGVFFDACDIFSDPAQIRQRILTLQVDIEKSPPPELHPAPVATASAPKEQVPQPSEQPSPLPPAPVAASEPALPAAAPKLDRSALLPPSFTTVPAALDIPALLSDPQALQPPPATPHLAASLASPPPPTAHATMPVGLDIDLGTLEEPVKQVASEIDEAADFEPTRHEALEAVRPPSNATKFMRREHFPADSVFGDVRTLSVASTNPQHLHFAPSTPSPSFGAKEPQWSRLRHASPASDADAPTRPEASQVGSFSAFKQRKAEAIASMTSDESSASFQRSHRDEVEELPWRGVNTPVAPKYRPRPADPMDDTKDRTARTNAETASSARTLKQRVFGHWLKP